MLDSYHVVLFVHVLLFVYWLGADLGVFVCGMVGRRRQLSEEGRRGLKEAGDLIDMFPRTALVLMIPVGLTLARPYGSPVDGPLLGLVWAACLAWLWLVWQVHFQHGRPLGKLFWKIDFAIRTVAMLAFVGFGAGCLITGSPIPLHWLAAKILLFGLIILAGIIVRILLLMPAPLPAAAGAPPPKGRNRLRDVVFVIWGLVTVIAFLGVTKPF